MITVNPAINYKNSNQSEYIRDSVLKIHIDRYSHLYFHLVTIYYTTSEAILCVHSSFEGTKRPKITFILFEKKVLSSFS